MKKEFYLIVHNIRSLHNVGTMFRTADALGINKIYLTGYTGTPPREEISKVALGADKFIPWEQFKNISALIKRLRKEKIQLVALEKTKGAVNYLKFKPRFPLALLVGNEVKGISASLLKQADKIIYLPMSGKKESLNVGVAMGAAGYYLNQYR